MSLNPGTQLGSYEILSLIGAGGMGEVYKARDPKLNRQVAIKILPADLAGNPDLLARFGREAKAVAALSHPNVLGIFDLASHGGLTYAVMELLEGDSLRDRLKAGALPPKRAIEIATELAQGLGAAHGKGIIHRDVKPENIFINKEGRVKVLDFGLAKQVAAPRGGGGLDTETLSNLANGTEAGMVLGTTGYMSPEQVRGEPADHRADIFAFGVVLYEMLSGRRPFQGETPMHTMTAILDEDPPELASGRGALPAGLERLVGHCLEKRPEARFQSMADVAYNLQNLSTLSSGAQGRPALARPRAALLRGALAGVAATLGLGLLLALANRLQVGAPAPPPVFTRLTFTPGTVEAAFFGADGRTVFFSERIQGQQPEIFVIPSNASEPKPLGVADALLRGVSPSNELAVLRGARQFSGSVYRGTLAQVDGGGGPARDIQDNVVDVAWDGPGLVLISSNVKNQITLEFPAGRTLVQANAATRSLRFLRLAKDGARLALVDSDTVNKSEIVVYDRAGHRTALFTKIGDAMGDTLTGLAWGPGGELWFSELEGDQTNVWTQSLGGRRRLLWRGEGTKALMDVSPDGRMLLADHQTRMGVLVQRAGETQPREVSVAGTTQCIGISADGKALLLLESPVLDGGTRQDATYLSRLDGAPALKMARGTAEGISADGRWIQLQLSGWAPEELDPAIAAAFRQAGLDPRAVLDPINPQGYLLFVPIGVGRPFVVALPKPLGAGVGYGFLHPDGKRVVFGTDEDGQQFWYVAERQGGAPRKLTPPGFGTSFLSLQPLSPDGNQLIIGSDDRHYFIQPLQGGEMVPIKGLGEREGPIGWTQDQRGIYFRNSNGIMPVKVFRLDLATGARTQVLQFQPADASGLLQIRTVFAPTDGRVFALTYIRKLSQLYRVDGVK